MKKYYIYIQPIPDEDGFIVLLIGKLHSVMLWANLCRNSNKPYFMQCVCIGDSSLKYDYIGLLK